MQKNKLLNNNKILQIIKCCLLGIIVTLLGIIVFAFVLKFVDLSAKAISYINDLIKILAIFITINCIKKTNGNKLLYKAMLAGIIYALLTFIIFSILNGGFVFNLSILYDLLFAIIVSIVVSVIINILGNKKV